MKKFFYSLIFLFMINLVSAQYGRGYYSPFYFFDNIWFRFGLVFLMFFTVIFFALKKTMKEGPVAGVLAFGISLYASMALYQRGWLYSYIPQGVGSWVLVICLLVFVVFVIKICMDNMGKWGGLVALLLVWFILKFFDPYDILPYELYEFIPIYETITQWGVLLVVILVGVVLSKFGGKGGTEIKIAK